MFLRAVLLLFLVVGLSVAATLYFGDEVLLALGLILIQLKIVAKKIAMIEWPSILVWLKTEIAQFFRIELLKKWFMTTALPLLIGNAVFRKLEAFVASYRAAISAQYDRLLRWYDGLQWYEKLIAALILLFGTLGLAVSSLGLWLILFSIKLPIWLIAAVSAFGRMVVLSVRKMLFKAVAFFQLSWLWKILRRRLPEEYLERKRKFDFRVARMVVRRRRMTVRQLAEKKDGLSMRLSLIAAYFRQPRPEIPDPVRTDKPGAPDDT